MEAYNDSLNEAKLVETALQKVIEENKVYLGNSVLKQEIEEYLEIFNNKQYRNMLYKIRNNIAMKDADILIMDPCTINLSKYVPQFLRKFKRLIYYTTEQKALFTIEK